MLCRLFCHIMATVFFILLFLSLIFRSTHHMWYRNGKNAYP